MGTDIPGESFAQGADLLRDWRQSSWWGQTAKLWRTGLQGDGAVKPRRWALCQDIMAAWCPLFDARLQSTMVPLGSTQNYKTVSEVREPLDKAF
jgi:hypothetical protein